MKRLLLLLLLSSWAHVGIDGIRCGTSIEMPEQILSPERSRYAGAKAGIQRAFKTETSEQCIEECCLSKDGSCSVATYKNDNSTGNCIHFSCHPVTKCKYVYMTSAISYALPLTRKRITVNVSSTEGLKPSYLSLSSVSSSTVVHIIPTTQTLVAVTTSSKTSSIVPTEHKIVSEIISTLNHITTMATSRVRTSTVPTEYKTAIQDHTSTIMPDEIHLIEDTHIQATPSNVSNIKPRKGVDMGEPIITYYRTNHSKIKPRKGVEQFHSLIMPTPVFNSPQDADASNLSSILEYIFQDEMNNTEYNHTDIVTTIGQSSTASEHNWFLKSKIAPHSDGLSISSSFSDSSSSTTVPANTLVLDSSESTVASDSSFYNTLPLSSHNQIPTVVKETLRGSDLETPTRQTSSLSPTTQIHSSKTIFVYEVTLNSSFQGLPLQHQATHEPSDNHDDERRYKSSMHIVLSLVFGLLVLFAVLGVVAKRIHDVWLRRHYHRMDFLVDGMYDGYS